MTFSYVLKNLREVTDVTQTDLANHLGVTRSTIAAYEHNRRQPDFELLLKIADYFHVSIDYLLRGTVPAEIKHPIFLSNGHTLSMEHFIHIDSDKVIIVAKILNFISNLSE